MTRLRLAVVGVGHLGKEHARILSGLASVELVGVADVNAAQAQTVAQRCGCRSFTDYRSVLPLVDAAVIAVPTTYHREVGQAFLEKGIPVLVEKPLALNLEQADELVQLAERQQTILQVGHIERFNPALEALQGRPLRPKFIDCQRLGAFTGRSPDIGVVLDLMIHDLDIVNALVGAPVRTVEAVGVAVFGANEDVAHARLSFADGCIATMAASRASMTPRRQMQVWGPEGYAGVDFAKRELTLVQPSAQLRRHGLDPRKLSPAALATLREDLFGKHLEVLTLACNSDSDQLTRELEHFVACVRWGQRPRVSGVEGREAIALATRILESMHAHCWEGTQGGATGPTELPAPSGFLFEMPAASAAA